MGRMNVEGATAIVTGGASGIGEACARQLAALGAIVIIADLQEERGQEIAAEIGGVSVRCDVLNEVDVASAIDAATSRGPLRVLVNSAGIGRPDRTLDRQNQPMSLQSFESVIRVNLIGTFNVLRLAAAAMAITPVIDTDGARGAIVNIASLAAFDGQVGQASYSASKAGVVGMTLPIARDLAPVGIRVNAIAPGPIETPIFGTGDEAEKMKQHLTPSIIFPRRLGTVEELAFMVLECLTNPFMNAETIRVDGGARLPAK